MATADFHRVGVNRHRGLRVEQLTRRYLRLRHGDDAAEGCQVCGGHDTSCCEDRWAYDDERDDGVDPEVVLGAWREGARYAAGRPRLADRLPAALRGRGPFPGPEEWTAAPRQKAEEGGSPLPLGEAAAGLPAALHEHVGRLRAELNPLDYIQSAGCQRTLRELSNQLPDREASFAIFSAHAGALGTALLFRRFWIRPLRTFAPPGERGGVALIAALVEHLFARYPVPGFLLRAWSGSSLPDFKWVCWTILLGQGGSLHAAARRFGWALGRGVIARLHEAPADLDPVAACMWAEIAHLGGGRIELERLGGDPAFTIDPTAQEEEGERFARREDFLPFWRQTVAWLIRYRDQLTEEGCRLILAWAMHLFTEGPRFSWSGRTPKGAEAAARAYEEERLLPYARRFWARKGWDREVLLGGRTWSVIELVSGRELYEEGRAMHHCVSGYAHRCAAGWAAIFSLREEGWRRVTVEITVPERRVVQARGACNRAATSEENEVLQRWLRAISGPTGGGPCAP